jgi:uncharacterized protein involved in response to NO
LYFLEITMNAQSNVDRRTWMDKDKLLALPPVLRAGFRMFFMLGPLWAIVVVGLWVEAMAGAITLPTALDPLAWHRHEMLFGYLGAVIAGFLLTAIPNWTGRLPLAGGRLAALASLWVAGRLAVLFSATVGPVAAMAIDVVFLLTLAGVCAREVLVARNRNVPIVGVVLLFAIASGIDHAEALGWLATDGLGWRAGFSIILILIALIGGRIIPSFTRNWLAKQGRTKGLPTQPGRFDFIAIGVLAAALVAWAAGAPAEVGAPLLLAAAGFHLVRMARWSGHATMAEPLVFILHLSYLWVPLGLLLLGTSLLVPTQPASSALHALAAGAMASMTLAVMTRATLGHTGRDLHADGGTTAIYALVTLGAALRVASPWLPFDYLLAIRISAALWTGAFLLFLLLYGPKLLGPRPDGKL